LFSAGFQTITWMPTPLARQCFQVQKYSAAEGKRPSGDSLFLEKPSGLQTARSCCPAQNKKAETAPSAYAPEPGGGPSRGSSCMSPRTFFKTPPSKPPDTRGRRAGRRSAPRKDGRDV